MIYFSVNRTALKMSADTYFCFCCLSTSELTNLFNSILETNSVSLLEELFNIKPCQSEYEEDSYICKDCIKKLKEAKQFKIVIFDTLNALQVNGLINLELKDGKYYVNKVINENVLEESDKLKSKVFDNINILFEDTGEPIEIKPIKQELIEQNKLENVKVLGTYTLEREKSTIVGRKKREKQPTKTEASYEVTEDLRCKLCSAVLPNNYLYHRHMNEHYPNYTCGTCGKGFLTEKRLKRHIPSHGKGPYKCQSCDIEFTNFNTYNSHRQRKHSEVDLYRCPHCPTRFRTLSQRATHLDTVHQRPMNKHACTLCDKTFVLAGNLSSHMRNIHLKVKKHLCAECGLSFGNKEDMRGHMSTHTGINEFVCSLCPKRYSRKKGLIVHMRTHTGDRRFSCGECGKKFFQKCTLLRHLEIHNKGKKVLENFELPEFCLNKEYW